jgi:hypothetical protein
MPVHLQAATEQYNGVGMSYRLLYIQRLLYIRGDNCCVLNMQLQQFAKLLLTFITN